MKRLEEAVIARLRKSGSNFEVFVDLEEALKVKEGKGDIKQALIVEEIYKDAKKGDRISSQVLKSVFGTDDPYKIAEIIIREGDIQITTEYRKKLIEQKRKQIIEEIRIMSIDPRTNSPFTPKRIEEMLNQVRYNVDPFKPVSTQVTGAIKLIKRKFPIRIETVTLKVIIPYDEIKSLNIIKKNFRTSNEDWGDKGAILTIEVPIGLLDSFYSEINKLTKGKAYIEEINKRN